MSDERLLAMLEEMRQEAWDTAVWIGGRIISHGIVKEGSRYKRPEKAKTLEAATGLATLMRGIQIAEFAARKRGLDIPWPERKDITGTLDVLGVTDYWSPESFDRLTNPADELHARALGIRLD